MTDLFLKKSFFSPLYIFFYFKIIKQLIGIIELVPLDFAYRFPSVR